MNPLNPLNVFHDLTGVGGRIGFFTLQNRDDIPAVAGCYGWFLPLWIMHERLPDFLAELGGALSHESRDPDELNAGFAWDSVKVRVRRTFEPSLPEFASPLWDRLTSSPERKDALQQILLQASILTSPLYVGKTENLRRRYNEHTKADGSGFNRRFRDYAASSGLNLGVDDLIFVSIRTQEEADKALNASADVARINTLIEEILKRLCRPPFSIQ